MDAILIHPITGCRILLQDIKTGVKVTHIAGGNGLVHDLQVTEEVNLTEALDRWLIALHSQDSYTCMTLGG